MKAYLRRYLQYARVYGAVGAARILAKFSQKHGKVRVAVPGIKYNVGVRAGTSDTRIFERVFLEGEYDLSLPISTPKLIVDAGANVGYTSIVFANRYPSARIIAIEPDASNYALLKDNVSSYSNIKPLHAALWPRSANVVISNADDQKWSLRVQESEADREDSIDTVTMSDIMNNIDVDTVDILKIDVEGSEKKIFESGYQSWLSSIKVIVIELHDRKVSGCSAAFYRAVSELEFNQYHKGMNVVWMRQ